jgi:hypothetical protein
MNTSSGSTRTVDIVYVLASILIIVGYILFYILTRR